MADNLCNQAENGLALLVFNRTTYSAMGLADSTGPANFYLSLHTGDPGEAGDATTSEAAAGLTGYSRKTIIRSSGAGGFTVTNGIAVNASDIVFTITAGTPALMTYGGLSIYASGAGALFAGGIIASGGVTLGPGVTATIAAGSLSFELK
jgi:hypothetical protein